MKTVFIILAIISSGIAMISCEANKRISVIVVDKLTQQPIDSVFVEVKAGKNGDYSKSTASGYTDANGKFETHMMIGCAFGCYDIYLEYTKNGYTKKVDFNITEGTIELDK